MRLHPVDRAGHDIGHHHDAIQEVGVTEPRPSAFTGRSPPGRARSLADATEDNLRDPNWVGRWIASVPSYRPLATVAAREAMAKIEDERALAQSLKTVPDEYLTTLHDRSALSGAYTASPTAAHPPKGPVHSSAAVRTRPAAAEAVEVELVGALILVAPRSSRSSLAWQGSVAPRSSAPTGRRSPSASRQSGRGRTRLQRARAWGRERPIRLRRPPRQRGPWSHPRVGVLCNGPIARRSPNRTPPALRAQPGRSLRVLRGDLVRRARSRHVPARCIRVSV